MLAMSCVICLALLASFALCPLLYGIALQDLEQLFVYEDATGDDIEAFRGILMTCTPAYSVADEVLKKLAKSSPKIPTGLSRGSAIILATTRASVDYKPVLWIDLDDLRVFPQKADGVNVPLWVTTQCDILLHEIVEATELLHAVQEAAGKSGFDMKSLVTSVWPNAHRAGIDMENRLRKARGAMEMRRYYCSHKIPEAKIGYSYLVIGDHTQVTLVRNWNLDSTHGVQYILSRDVCTETQLEIHP